jgi:hypothetical protein
MLHRQHGSHIVLKEEQKDRTNGAQRDPNGQFPAHANEKEHDPAHGAEQGQDRPHVRRCGIHWFRKLLNGGLRLLLFQEPAGLRNSIPPAALLP